jgi:Leucine-rich repeat (LRR) protein
MLLYFLYFKLKRLPFLQASYNISELYLQDNLLRSVDNYLRPLTNLKILFLQGNQLDNLNNAAQELSYLKCLNNLSNYIYFILF